VGGSSHALSAAYQLTVHDTAQGRTFTVIGNVNVDACRIDSSCSL
jgi:hypothetical protein